jgi:hypothetical protein
MYPSQTQEYRRQYRLAHRERYNAKDRNYYHMVDKPKRLARMRLDYVKNSPQIKEKHVCDPRLRMLVNAKHRAKKRGIPFDLTLADLGSVPSVCPALGIPISPLGGRDNRPEIDRLIPAKGYVRGNVVIISSRANRIKNDGTLAELTAITKWLFSLVSK